MILETLPVPQQQKRISPNITDFSSNFGGKLNFWFWGFGFGV
jgi:hypothetical protein